jgi:AcrR family transcriptional regulator
MRDQRQPEQIRLGSGPLQTRQRILALAEQLYVLHGHDGFSFGDIAALVDTTRANIHHHFGNKRRLMAELVERFAADASSRIDAIWATPGQSFAARLRGQQTDLRRFYDRFNSETEARNVWSPVARMRLDLPVLGELGRQALERVNRAYDVSLRHAVTEAIRNGELKPRTPADDLVRILRVTFLSCGPITQDTGSFDDVSAMLEALGRMLDAAWGGGQRPNVDNLEAPEQN